MTNEIQSEGIISLESASNEFAIAYGPSIGKLIMEKLTLLEENVRLKTEIVKLKQELESLKNTHKKD